ncbi:pyridoxamine 5'-phosphate oxidase family protein [Planctomycetota bacterium]
MGDEKSEAMAFVRDNTTSHVSTVHEGAPCARVMSVGKLDDDLHLWYATFRNSNKVRQIAECPKVCVTICAQHRDMRVFGTAIIHDDEEKRHSLWKDELQQYFPGGKDDPEYVVMEVLPDKAEYRDFEKYGMAMKRVI